MPRHTTRPLNGSADLRESHTLAAIRDALVPKLLRREVRVESMVA